MVQSVSHWQKWNSCQQLSKNCISPNIQLKGVVKRLPPFKILSDHTNSSLMGYDNRKIKHYIKKLINFKALEKKPAVSLPKLLCAKLYMLLYILLLSLLVIWL